MDNRLIILVLIIGLLTSCGPAENTEQSGQLNIVTTTGMIEDAVRNIVGDSASIQALMGPGVDPHLFKATQGDLKKLTGANIIFYNGLHLEGKMGEVLEKLGNTKPVIAVTSQIEESRLRKVPEFNDSHDPHIWFDVDLWKEAVRQIDLTMQEIDEKNKVYYHNNALRYMIRLDSLHSAVKSEIATIPKTQRVLITAHDAFGYFGEAYDIEVKGLQGISTLSEYGLRDVSDLAQFIADRQIKAVFVETSVSEKAINAVVEGCKQKGVNVNIGGSLYSDAMGAKGSPQGTYIGMVNANVQTIVNALK